MHFTEPAKYIRLPHSSILQGLNGTNTTTLSNQLANILLAQLLHNRRIKHNLQAIRSGKSRLEGLPNLLLGVEHTLRLTLPSLKEDPVTGLGALGGRHQLHGALVVINLTGLDLGRGSEDHGAGFDAAHLDGLEIANDDDLAALHLLEGDMAVEAGADGSADLAFVLDVILVTSRVTHGDGGDVERVSVGVVDGLENVAYAEVDQARGEGGRGGRGLLRLGSLLLLFFLGLVASDNSSSGTLHLVDLVLGLILCAVDKSGSLVCIGGARRSGSGSGLFLL